MRFMREIVHRLAGDGPAGVDRERKLQVPGAGLRRVEEAVQVSHDTGVPQCRVIGKIARRVAAACDQPGTVDRTRSTRPAAQRAEVGGHCAVPQHRIDDVQLHEVADADDLPGIVDAGGLAVRAAEGSEVGETCAAPSHCMG